MMQLPFDRRTPLTLLATSLVLAGCASTAPTTESTATDSTTDSPTDTASNEPGTLAVRANGEDFVRQGFTTKDGWRVEFENLYAHVSDVTAYQTDPPYDAFSGGEPDAKESVVLVDSQTVDLAAGDETAEPILLSEVEAPAGQYNALSWKMTPASEGPAEGYSLVLDGTAEKDGETVDFILKLDEPLAFTCGEFVGDERKGILSSGGNADLEATFHFDHLFGDGDAPADDEINTGALGFEPIAELAENGTVEVDLETLSERLSPEEYETLKNLLPSLGHVGEGHCHESMMAHQD
ncbi:DUF4382 domain-containing protein [Baaleninema sp.]|uniref:DUF4382 domain-containing protein n=1 Tax=Baaleninema sp. TaxID=3101197 RepID=UPI003CFC40AD